MRYGFAVALCVILGVLIYRFNSTEAPQATPAQAETVPLPPHTAQLVADIRHIATTENLDFQSLWESHTRNPDLLGLIQKRWILSDPTAAKSATKDSELEKQFWIEWGSQEGEVAYRHAEKIGFQEPWFTLTGWAKVDPRAVIKFIESEELTLEPEQSEEIIPAILRGLAKKNWQDALDYPAQAKLPNTFEFESVILHEWAEKNPAELLDYLLSNRRRYENTLIESVTRIIGKNTPSLLEESLQKLPTGTIKSIFQDILKNGHSFKPHCPPNPLESPSVSIRKKEGSPDFLGLVAQASKITTEEYPNWIMGKFFNYLPVDEQKLIRQIVTQRWIHEDPVAHIKFLDSHHIDNWVESLVRWIEIDRESAMKFPSSRDKWSKEVAGKQLVAALAHIDVAQAIDEYLKQIQPEGDSENYYKIGIDQWDWYWILKSLKDKDPNGFRREVEKNITNGKLLKFKKFGVSNHWQMEDLPWLIETFQRQELDLNQLKSWFSRYAFFDNFELLPEDWRRDLAEQTSMIYFDNIRLFALPPPEGFDRQHLLKRSKPLHIGRIEKENRLHATRLIREGTFLSDYYRRNIARNVIYSFEDQFDQAAKWIDKIPEQFQSSAKEQLHIELEEHKKRLQKPRKPIPHALLESLNLSYQELDLEFSHYWSDAHWTKILERIKLITPEKSKEVIDLNHHADLPIQLKAALITRANEAINESNHILSRVPRETTNIAGNWAKSEPIAASQWAEKLAPGIVRENALHMVAHEWKKFDREEMKTWARTLPKEETEKLGVH